MPCVSTVSYSVLINGQLGKGFKPQRGLHQGYLISPYLFIVCAEGFSVILNEVETSKRIKVVQVAKGAPLINHLFFADDSLLYFPVNINEWQQMQLLLEIYTVAIKQILNQQNTSIFFSSNTSRVSQSQIIKAAGVTECSSQK